MLRVKNPLVSVPFYEQHFGFKLVQKYDFPQWDFSLYFLGIFPEGTVIPQVGTTEADDFLWTMSGQCLELTHNYGTETDDTYATNNGNVEPHRY
jgi:lactoylglutathione lyase